MQKVIVTGGAGYIGSHTIIELLDNGYEVFSVDNFCNSSPAVFNKIYKITGKKVKNYNLDISDSEKVDKFFKGKKFDAIIHFAALKSVGESVENPLKYYKNNIGSLLGALSIAKKCDVSYFIFSSTGIMYGPKNKPPYSEEDFLDPVSPYAKTKQVGEEILKNFISCNSKIKAVSLRYFNPAGAHESLLIGENPNGNPNNLLPVIVKAVKENKIVTIFGSNYDTIDGTCVRDYIHVSDVAKAHIKALKYLKLNRCNYDVFNIGVGRGLSTKEVIRSFEEVNNVRVSVKIGKRRPGDIAIVFANTEKAKKILNWKAQYDISDIMKTAWEWGRKI